MQSATDALLIPQSVARPVRADVAILLCVVSVFGILSTLGSITSEGFLEADGCTHFLFARAAFDEPHYLVNIWGRPLKTMLYVLPAHFFGLTGVRFTSLVVAIAILLLTYAIARGQKYRWPALATIACVAQPMFFLHSFSELTELPFAMVLAGAFLAYQRRQFFVMTLLVAVTPLGRPEGFGMLLLGGLSLLAHRRAYWIPLLVVPLLVWNYAGWVLFGRPDIPWYLWLKNEWPYAATSVYASGSLWHFLGLLPVVTGPLVFPGFFVGVGATVWGDLRGLIRSLRSGAGGGSSDERESSEVRISPQHRRHCDLLIVAIPMLILIAHSILYFTGKMASSGEARYMLTAAPFWALLVAKGLTWMFDRLAVRRVHLLAGLLAVAPALINFKVYLPGGWVFGYQVLPLQASEDWKIVRHVVESMQQSGELDAHACFAAAHPGVFYFLGVSPTAPRVVPFTRGTLAHPPADTLLIWDRVYAQFNADINRTVSVDFLLSAGWTVKREITKDWLLLKSPNKPGT